MKNHQPADHQRSCRESQGSALGCRVPSWSAWVTSSLIFLLVCPAFARPADFPRRIEEDTTWSGTVEIPHDVTISGARVTVEAGSTIRFVTGTVSPLGPSLRLEMPVERPMARPCSSLRFEGTEDRPIIVETPQGYPPGSIIAAPSACGSFYASHVVFRRLGDVSIPTRPKPALRLRFSRREDDLWLKHCRFEACGPVWAEFFGEHASAEIAHCRFTDTAGPLALMLAGRGAGIKRITHVRADAALRLECSQVLVHHNILIGRHAQIDVSTPAARRITLSGNYVHCTEPRDVGRYALRCRSVDARMLDNVLIGGTYAVAAAPRVVKGNVLIGTSGLEVLAPAEDARIERLNLSAPTHYLIAELPPGAEVTDNLFLGPCYAALTTGPPAHDITIAHNTFDGWGLAHRALQLLTPVAPSSYRELTTDDFDAEGEIGRLKREMQTRPAETDQEEVPERSTAATHESLQAVLSHNIFTRYDLAAIDNRDRQTDAFREFAHNVFAQVNQRPYAVGSERTELPLNGNRQYNRFEELGFALSPTTQQAAAMAALENDDVSVEDLRRAWFDAYRIKPDSVLAGEEIFGPR